MGVLLALAPLPAAAARKPAVAKPATTEPQSTPAGEATNPAHTAPAPDAPRQNAPAGPKSDDRDDTDDESEAAPLADRVILYEYTHHVRPKEFNFSLGGGFNNFGLALWFAIPVLDDGLLPDVNDQLNVEVGLVAGLYRDLVYWDPTGQNYWTLAVSGGLRWDFHVTQAWVPFALLKIAVNFGFDKIVLPGGGIGVLYRLTDDWRLRLELGYPLGISAGLTFDLPTL